MAGLCGNTWLYHFSEVDEKTDIEMRISLWEVCTTTYKCGSPDKTCVTPDSETVPG